MADMVKWFNITGCEPVTHGFESHYPPHIRTIKVIQTSITFFVTKTAINGPFLDNRFTLL
jgi:hypothetical protein